MCVPARDMRSINACWGSLVAGAAWPQTRTVGYTCGESMATPSTALRTKLTRLMLVILLLVGAGIVAIVAWSNWTTEQRRMAQIEARVSATINSKAQLLVQGQAIAMRSLVSDNALSDIADIVERSVQGDPDIVYGVLLNPEGKALAYASPATLTLPPADRVAAIARWTELAIPASTWKTAQPASRNTRAFNQSVREFSHPVMLNSEPLGMLVYGFTTRQLEQALLEVRAESEQSLMSLLMWLGVAGAAATLLGFLMVSSMSRRITTPLSELTDAANAIAEGKRSVRVQPRTRDELAVLANAFNQMQQSNEETMLQLEQRTEAALEAARVKGEFLANMSHEIRTPMNGVLGMLRLMLTHPMGNTLKSYARTAESSAQALLTVIDDVLDFSKLEAGKYVIQQLDFDPAAILAEVARLHSGRAREKGIDLTQEVAADVPKKVCGDPDRMRQVLNNLVSNAVKFTDSGCIEAELSLQASSDQAFVLRVVVRDTGLGISESDQSELFEAFTQADSSSEREHGGTGLGLAISKQLVQLMGGQIGVQSHEGRGSEFWFTLRVLPAKDQSLTQDPRAESGSSAVDSLELPSYHVVAPASRRARGQACGTALVVEDNDVNLFVAVEQLATLGFDVEVASHGREALQQLEQHEVQIVFMDCQMPVMDGYAATREIRQREQTSESGGRVPIVALTAHAMAGERARVLEVGMDDYLSKPLRPGALEDVLRRHVPAFAELHPAPASGAAESSSQSADGTDKLHVLDPSIPRSAKLCKLFLARAPLQLEQLSGVVADQELEQTRTQAHKLKGTCYAVGAQRMAKVARELEEQAAENQLNPATDKLDELIAEYQFVSAELQRELASHAGNQPSPP